MPTAESGDSDDDEDIGDYFVNELAKVGNSLQDLEKKDAPWDIANRFGNLSHDICLKILSENEGFLSALGPIPPGLEQAVLMRPPSPSVEQQKKAASHAPEDVESDLAKPKVAPVAAPNKPDGPVETPVLSAPKLETESMDVDATEPSPTTVSKREAQDGDIPMSDVPAASPLPENEPSLSDQIGRVIGDTPLGPALNNGASPGSQLPTPPSQEEDEGDETESDDVALMLGDSIREVMKTPPIDSLPDFYCKPWEQDTKFLQTLESNSVVDSFILDQLHSISLEKETEQEEARQTYMRNYSNYLDFTLSNDPVAAKHRERVYGPAESAASAGSAPESRSESRSGGRRFATERDLERVLQASMKEDEERRQREIQLQQEKYRSEKEAIIPPMYWNDKEIEDNLFFDTTGYTPVDALAYAWQCLPPISNFTEEEAAAFEKSYLERPKQWGPVAESIPNRDFRACIQYYYLKKKDLNLKEKLKKQPKRRKKGSRGKQRSSALVSELGNGENETEENQDAAEGGERRRPRRAAAPTFGSSEQNDSDGLTPGATGRRGNGAKENQPEKVDGRKGRRKAAKDKEPKSRGGQSAGTTPVAGRGRSRSTSRALNADTPVPTGAAEAPRLPTTYEQPTGIQAPTLAPAQQQAVLSPGDRPGMQTSTMSDLMAPPSALAPPQLRPEPIPPPQPVVSTLNFVQPTTQPQTERRAQNQASSYWSVSEITEFPALLRALGSDWSAIANHMGSKTTVMVSCVSMH